MAILAFANVSSYARWVLLDDSSQTILASVKWTNEETKDISSQYSTQLETLLASARSTIAQIKSIIVVTGPGTFTGLRNSSIYAVGLATSLKIPLQTLSVFDLYQKDCFIPTRHQIAKDLDLAAAQAANLEFIKSSATTNEIATPTEGDLILGLKDRPDWPAIDELKNAIAQNRAKPKQKIEITYGITPKISGQRL